MTAEEQKNIIEKAYSLKMQTDDSFQSEEEVPKGLELLTLLSKQKRVLAGNTFGTKDRTLLSAFPQFGSVWRWQRNLRLAFLYTSNVPDYDITANAELEKILKVIAN